ncbi:hypothetical protein M3Y95_00815100 [Aphelenchoides besseyi]|nr:hypothetical protein M3Y95_00815100 [Aphelenchoides besseyi]
MTDVRQLNLIFYSFVFFIVGFPLWWITTSPYRAALQPLDPSVVDVEVPFHLRIFYESHLIRSDELRSLLDQLMAKSPDVHLHAEFVDVEFHTTSEEADNLEAFNYALGDETLNVVLLEAKQFTRHFPRSSSDFNSTVFSPKPNARALAIRFDGTESLSRLLERVLGLQRLDAIANEDVQKTLSVWDRLPISTLYHLHLVFLHFNGRQNTKLEDEVVDKAKQIANFAYQKGGVLIDVSTLHLWDFDVDQFVEKRAPKNSSVHYFLPNDNAEAITTEVDKFVSWFGVGVAQPLIKVAVFVDDREIEIKDEKSEKSNAISVASWGGLTTMNVQNAKAATRVSQAILDIVKTQLNIRPIEPNWHVDFDSKLAAQEFEWLRFRIQSFREHIERATTALRSIHALRRKIEDMVISREVAVDVYESHEVLMATLLKARRHGLIDMDSAIRARILAERAAKHPSTLQYLNFPLEQRYAIYVPLFLPVFVHIFTSIRPLIPVIRASLFASKVQ